MFRHGKARSLGENRGARPSESGPGVGSVRTPLLSKSGGKVGSAPGHFLPVIKLPEHPVEAPGMLRVTSTLFATVFLAASGKTADSLTSNGDTAVILLETVICVVLLTGALYFRGLWETRRSGQ